MWNPKFKEFLAYGEALEKASEQFLFPKLFPLCDAFYIGNNNVWRNFGADYLLHDKRINRVLLIEIKADFKDTGNIVVETHSRDDNGQVRLGWFYTSKADYILYIGIKQKTVSILETAKLRAKLTERQFPIKFTKLNQGYLAYFYVIPWTWVLAEFPSISIPDDEWTLWQALIDKHLEVNNGKVRQVP